MAKMKKKIVYESELEPIPIFKIREEGKNSETIKARFELNSEEEDYEIDSSLLSEVKRSIKETEEYKIDMRNIGYGRYGSVVHLSDKNRWTLDLITRHIKATTNQRSSITDVIDIFINEATVSSHNFFEKQKADDDKEYLMKNIRGLNQVFCLKDTDRLSGLGSYSDIKYKGNIVELFIPDITFHVIDFFRALFLSIVEPNLLDIDEMILINQVISFDLREDIKKAPKNNKLLLSPVSLDKPKFKFDRKNFSDSLKDEEINFSQIHSQAKIMSKEIANEKKRIREMNKKNFEDNYKKRAVISQREMKDRGELSVIDMYTDDVAEIIKSTGFINSEFRCHRIARSVIKNLSLIGYMDEDNYKKITRRFYNLKQLSNYSGKIVFE